MKERVLEGIKGLQRCKAGEVDEGKKRRVMAEGGTGSPQTGDVGGNDVGVGSYLYLEECRWARGEGRTVCFIRFISPQKDDQRR